MQNGIHIEQWVMYLLLMIDENMNTTKLSHSVGGIVSLSIQIVSRKIVK